jgi:DNA-binding XRE family transcriptional regulator
MKMSNITQGSAIDLAGIRKELDLSQPELAALLAVSPRTIQSCEQGWRTPSASLERAALLLLLTARNGSGLTERHCWEMTACPPHLQQECVAFTTGQGHLCWFLTGTICHGERHGSWHEKISLCADCSFFSELLQGELPTVPIKR